MMQIKAMSPIGRNAAQEIEKKVIVNSPLKHRFLTGSNSHDAALIGIGGTPYRPDHYLSRKIYFAIIFLARYVSLKVCKETLMGAGRRQAADEILRVRAENWPEAVTPIAHLMVRVFRFGNLVLDNATRQVAAHGLTLTEFEALATLRGAPPPHALAPTDLYGAVLISSGGLTKVLYALQARNLITRAEAGTDRRSKPVRLTPKGRALAERAMADVLRTDGELISSGLSQAEIERLTRLLRKLLATLEPRDSDT
jgi:DNA-binding MarR family transcriptional regulator